MIEVVVESVRAKDLSEDWRLILRQRDGSGILMMNIGPVEADAIALRLDRVVPARPLIHDVFTEVLDQLGATVSRVEIPELKDHMFKARLIVARDDAELAFEARPSDAITLALCTDAPIYAAEEILVRVCSKPIAPSNLDVFKEFIESLGSDNLVGT